MDIDSAAFPALFARTRTHARAHFTFGTSSQPAAYRYVWTADTPGTFEYFCEPHSAEMHGTINVIADYTGITITQSGDIAWRMSADVDNVVSSPDEDWPTLTIIEGTAVTFVGSVTPTHTFSVKDASSGVVVVGPSAEDASYRLTWIAPAAGVYA